MALTTTANVKAYLGITVTTYDTLIDRLVLAAQNQVEMFTNRKWDTATFTEYHDGNNQDTIVLKNTPIQSITSIGLRKDNDEWTTIAATGYDFDAGTGVVQLLNSSRVLWELGYDPQHWRGFGKGLKSVQAVYVAGYDTIPAGLEQATIELVSSMFGSDEEVRQAKANGLLSESLGYQSRTFRTVSDEMQFMEQRFGLYRRLPV